ncbi:hypothetical protein MACH17_09480 [Phaeobacter inhibens]|nr:hypothetical protein MACH17_09480 [Phaeobacter inhibens]
MLFGSFEQFSPDRKGHHPKDHLAKYQGWMHADGYAGFEDLYRSGDIREVACMAHVRRKFVDIHRAQGSAIADEAIMRCAIVGFFALLRPQCLLATTYCQCAPPSHFAP